MRHLICLLTVLLSLVMATAAVAGASSGAESPGMSTGSVANALSGHDFRSRERTERLPILQGEGSADLSIGTDGPETAPVDGRVVFHIVVPNNGPDDADRVAVVDFLPAGVDFVAAQVTEGSGDCRKTVRIVACDLGAVSAATSRRIEIVARAPLQPGDITNHVAVAATTPDPNPDNDSAFWTTTVLPLPPDQADLRVTKSGSDTVLASEVFSYTMEVFNLGGADATSVTLTDTLPLSVSFVSAATSSALAVCQHEGGVVLCTLDTLATYQTWHVTVTVQAPAVDGSITNSVSVTGAEPDPDQTDNVDSVTTNVMLGPVVTDVAPASGATDVSVSTNISATFSEEIDPATLSATTFTLIMQGETTPVTATVSYSQSIHTAVLDPEADLAAETTYTATIKGGPGGITDLEGIPLAADVIWSFTTEAPEPWTGVIELPGRFEVENYRPGGEGVGYHDATPGNSGGAYRTDDVDIQVTADSSGAYNVGWIHSNEWLAYDVTIATCGFYTFTVRVATPHSGKSMHVELADANVTAPVEIPNTGGWQNWTDVTAGPVTLPAGDYPLRLVFDTGDFNVNYVVVEKSPARQSSSEQAPGDIAQDDCSRAPAAEQRSYLPFTQK